MSIIFFVYVYWLLKKIKIIVNLLFTVFTIQNRNFSGFKKNGKVYWKSYEAYGVKGQLNK